LSVTMQAWDRGKYWHTLKERLDQSLACYAANACEDDHGGVAVPY